MSFPGSGLCYKNKALTHGSDPSQTPSLAPTGSRQPQEKLRLLIEKALCVLAPEASSLLSCSPLAFSYLTAWLA